MTTLKDFVKEQEFGCAEGDTIPFPEGKTKINLEETTVEDKMVEFPEGPKKRYILTVGDKQYWAGPQIMEQVKALVEEGFDRVIVNRKGQGLKTKYTVLPAK